MIGRLRGILIEKRAPELLIEIGGVGYDVRAPMSTFYRLPAIGCEVTLHTHFIVREDGQQLYGFYDQEERTLFRSLIKVNGVGPSLALTILSGMEPQQFKRCIMENDVSALVRLPKVGKKIAERLIIEMADKFSDWNFGDNVKAKPVAHQATDEQPIAKEAISALVALGYKPQQASQAIQRINLQGMTVEQLIREALQKTAVV